ncbi:MAG TPA: PLD nuclease N-terminal domain-containing protein [Chitinophagaceae bacterium]|nr:PLD nuclease N-terminal domain-containing protein [Chitinophagaceae bacterium]
MKPITRFNIILGIISIILVVAGSALIGKSQNGNYILYSGFLAGTIFSLTSIIDVARSRVVRPSRKIVWLIMVICVPVVGGLLYYVIEYGKSSRDVISAPDSEDSF